MRTPGGPRQDLWAIAVPTGASIAKTMSSSHSRNRLFMRLVTCAGERLAVAQNLLHFRATAKRFQARGERGLVSAPSASLGALTRPRSPNARGADATPLAKRSGR